MILKIIIIAIVLISVAVMWFFVGKRSGYLKGYNKGYSAGESTGYIQK